ncbi:hypothetical protein FRC04_003527 [Tulasnella sp. 424]|nr:hypothetical protein FRC04_003527 [Tulasnella sp. 424]KAG8960675.1 hypothetical protein FRC05_006697 [Tulasnella sp. 425]
MLPSISLLVLAISSIPFASVLAGSHGNGLPRTNIRDPPPPPTTTSATEDQVTTPHYFDQLIDHNNPSLGTFKQRYWFSDEYWTRQGAPIVLSNPGEQSADGFEYDLINPVTLQGALMMSLGAAGVVLEHRYWGESSPYQTLSTANLKYLNVDQAIEDSRYFIENVKLPWSKKATSSHPDDVPWVNMGCSYPGELSAYTQKKYPKKFAAAWASSAPVQALGDFWQYFEPIEEGMPKNCSKDLAAAIKEIDQTLLNGSNADKQNLKKAFGLYDLKDDDFGQVLAYPLFGWQSMQASSYATSGEDPFFQFCDAIETHPDGTIERTAKGVGMPTALNNFAKYMLDNYASGCSAPGGGCYTTYDYTSTMYTDLSVSGADRQWSWMVCNEFGWFQDGDPGNYSSIVSSLVTPGYNLRQCNYMFPNADGTPGSYYPDTFDNNLEHGGGWNLRARNLFVVNGEFDPWRSASLSSRWAPKFRNTPHQRVEVVKGGHHCWDWNLDGAKYDHDIKRVVDRGIKKMRSWVRQWYKKHRNVENSMPKGKVDIWAGIL